MNLNWFHFLTSGMRIANRISVMLVKGGGMSLDKVTCYSTSWFARNVALLYEQFHIYICLTQK